MDEPGKPQAADIGFLVSTRSWPGRGRRAALATVLRTWNSSPRSPGLLAAIAPDRGLAL